MAPPSRVAVDETQIEVDDEEKWLYAAIDTVIGDELAVDSVEQRVKGS